MHTLILKYIRRAPKPLHLEKFIHVTKMSNAKPLHLLRTTNLFSFDTMKMFSAIFAFHKKSPLNVSNWLAMLARMVNNNMK